MSPLVWYAPGIRIRGRTAVEVTRDQHAEFLGQSVADALAAAGFSVFDVMIDPFVGSGNLLFHVLRATKLARGVGIDNNAEVMDLTTHNFARMRNLFRLRLRDLQLHHGNWTQTEHYLENRPTLVIVDCWGRL